MPCWRLADVVLLPGGGDWKLSLIWCCCLVMETGSWCWFGAAAWGWKLEVEADFGAAALWWKLEAEADFGAAAWWWMLEADADLVLKIVAWISGAGCRSLKQMPGSLGGCPGAIGCADLLDFANFCWFCWLPSLGESPGMEWIQLAAKMLEFGWKRWSQYYTMFEKWPVTQLMVLNKPVWLPVVWNVGFAGWNYWILAFLMQICGYLWSK